MNGHRRISDRVHITWLFGTLAVALWGPVLMGLAQTQEYINGSTGARLDALVVRMDRMETLVLGALVASVGTLISLVIQIWQNPERRKS